MNKIIVGTIAAALSIPMCFGQASSVEDLKGANINWQNKDLKADATAGVSVRKAYLDFLKDKKAKKTVVVAVIDSGVDVEHEDLQDKIWTNRKEIPGNKIDDDKNGYVDDIHGWSFLGGSSGENINEENLEFTRIVKRGKKDNPLYGKAKAEYDADLKQKTLTLENLEKTVQAHRDAIAIIKTATEIEVKSLTDLEKVTSTEEKVVEAKLYLENKYKNGFSLKGIRGYITYLEKYVGTYLNLDFNPREVVGDDPYNMEDRDYGNNDVRGPAATHGTFVAGIIAAKRNNNLGIDGIADNVQIMALRAIPDGDERDKDVALAIIYAVDNGADIINMSFGKTYSPNKTFVDKAVKYAEDNNVLLVHAAGNEGKDIDVHTKYPSNIYTDGTWVKTWLTVGANSAKAGKELPAIFSNYGAKNVDLFAPGVQVVSIDTGSTYNKMNGTSFSCPVVAGVAALVLSHYPELTAVQLKDILKETAVSVKPSKVYVPGRGSKKRVTTKFKNLS
ncbi:MAG: S8 family peptidase, partial [Vicingaceae bacterium]|nr:S8 family peptidase [Vicingaceae bacterium]